MTTPCLRIVGMRGSPYSRKLLAALRYPRLPHAWIGKDAPHDRNLPLPMVSLLSQLLTGDGADQWLTKAMFHYRWTFAVDIHRASEIPPR